MADLISQLKFTVLSARSDEDNFIPLRNLLIEDIEGKDTRKNKKKTDDVSSEQEKNLVQSRRASRAQRRSRTSPDNQNAVVTPADAADIRIAQIRSIQKRNNDVLLRLNEDLDSRDISSNTLRGSPDASGIIADLESQPDPNPRSDFRGPVILSLVDFYPCYLDGRQTRAFKSLEMKRAARMLNVDLQVDDWKDQRIKSRATVSPIPIATALADHIRSRNAFLDSLEVNSTNFQYYTETLAGLGLGGRSSSNTEALYTVSRDLAASIKYGSPLLSEMETRFFYQDGIRMPADTLQSATMSKAADLYQQLSRPWTQLPVSRITSVEPDDTELLVKILASTVGRETLFSMNMYNNANMFTEVNSDGSRGSVFIPQFADPSLLLNVDMGANRLSVDWTPACHGILFKSKIDSGDVSVARSNTAANYPYESVTLRSQNDARRTNTGPSFVKQLYDTYNPDIPRKTFRSNITSETFDSPYSVVKDSLEYGLERIGALINVNTSANADITRPLRDILGLTYRSLHGSLDYGSGYVVTPKIFELAANNHELFRTLLVYLAFRQERKLNYSGVGDPPPGASSLLRKSRWLSNSPMLSSSRATLTKLRTIDPSKLTVSPPIGGRSIFEAPETRTTIGIEVNAGEEDSGTLESVFDKTFEEIADDTAYRFYQDLRSYGRAGIRDAQGIASEFPEEQNTYPFPASLDNMKSHFRAMFDPEYSPFDSIYDSCCLKYEDYMNGSAGMLNYNPNLGSAYSIYSQDNKTLFNNIDREALFATFVYLFCNVQKLILPNLGVRVASDMTPTPRPEEEYTVPGIGPPPPDIGVSDPRVIKSPGFSSKLSQLKSFIDDPSRGVDSLTANFPEMARIYSELTLELQLLYRTVVGMYEYYERVERKYNEMKRSLEVNVTAEKGPIETLGARLSRGLASSTDLVRLLLHYPNKLNGPAMSYGKKRVNDNVISNTNFSSLDARLRHDPQLNSESSDDIKIMAVGLPTGLLDSLESFPTTLDDARRDTRESSDLFSLVIQKTDETKPDVVYSELEFTFLRSLFVTNVSEKIGAAFDAVDKDLRIRSIRESGIRDLLESADTLETGLTVLENHKKDFFLKQYLDLQHDLDFNENAFPAGYLTSVHVDETVSDKVKINALSSIDFNSLSFLSSSNLIYSPENVSFQSMPFFADREFTLDITKKDFTDPYRYSAFDYANTFGALFDGFKERNKLNSGLIFERTLCVCFKDEDFTIRRIIPIDDDAANAGEAQAHRMRIHEDLRAVDPFGRRRLPDAKMITYRAYIKLHDESILKLEDESRGDPGLS